MNDPTINIIPGLKELSVGMFGKNEGCGNFGLTLENCIADYNETTNLMVKRVYGGNDENKDLNPNNFLLNNGNFNVRSNLARKNLNQKSYLNNNSYLKNWQTLFSDITNVVSNKSGGNDISMNNSNNSSLLSPLKSNLDNSLTDNSVKKTMKSHIYISGHQHVFANKFFAFANKSFGFRNCTCVKVSMENNNISIKVIYPDDKQGKIFGNRDKSKYTYLSANSNLSELANESILMKNTYPTIQNCGEFINFLNSNDIFLIRHGEALHNLNDYIKVNGNNNLSIEEEYLNCRIKNEKPKYNKYARPNFFLNSALTSIGKQQAINLYNEVFKNKQPAQRFYFSSPMDRTIETLIYATSGPKEFMNLKNGFETMRKNRFTIDTDKCSYSDNLNRDTISNQRVYSNKPVGGKKRKSKKKIKRNKRNTQKRKKNKLYSRKKINKK